MPALWIWSSTAAKPSWIVWRIWWLQTKDHQVEVSQWMKFCIYNLCAVGILVLQKPYHKHNKSKQLNGLTSSQRPKGWKKMANFRNLPGKQDQAHIFLVNLINYFTTLLWFVFIKWNWICFVTVGMCGTVAHTAGYCQEPHNSIPFRFDSIVIRWLWYRFNNACRIQKYPDNALEYLLIFVKW